MRKSFSLFAGMLALSLSLLACGLLYTAPPSLSEATMLPAQPTLVATQSAAKLLVMQPSTTPLVTQPAATLLVTLVQPTPIVEKPNTLEPTVLPILQAPNNYLLAAQTHLSVLSAEIGARPPGSAAEALAAEYIEEIFSNLGYITQRQAFTFSSGRRDSLKSANIIAVNPGLSEKVLVIGAHYDSGDEALGADDNASGIAVLLAVAERVAGMETPYTLRFIAFGAEENDLDGSHAYVDSLNQTELQNIIAMINLDSLIAGDYLYIYGDRGPGSLHAWFLNAAQTAGMDLIGMDADVLDDPDGTLCECADYDAFQAAGVPFVYFEATNWDLGDQDGMTQVNLRYGDDGVIRHTRYDTLSYIEKTFPGRIEHHLDVFITLLFEAVTKFQ